MYLNNYLDIEKKEIFTIFLLIIFSALIRIPVIIIFGDTNLENEWAQLVNSLINQKGLSMHTMGLSAGTNEGLLLPN